MNYVETFIEVAPDCPALSGVVPMPKNERKSVAAIQYELLSQHPYTYIQEDLLSEVHVQHKRLAGEVRARGDELRKAFFARPQACLRSSPLPKHYGWGLHFDKAGKIALVAVGSAEYEKLVTDETVNHLKAMRSSRA